MIKDALNLEIRRMKKRRERSLRFLFVAYFLLGLIYMVGK